MSQFKCFKLLDVDVEQCVNDHVDELDYIHVGVGVTVGVDVGVGAPRDDGTTSGTSWCRLMADFLPAIDLKVQERIDDLVPDEIFDDVYISVVVSVDVGICRPGFR